MQKESRLGVSPAERSGHRLQARPGDNRQKFPSKLTAESCF